MAKTYEQLKAQGYTDFKIKSMGVQVPTGTAPTTAPKVTTTTTAPKVTSGGSNPLYAKQSVTGGVTTAPKTSPEATAAIQKVTSAVKAPGTTPATKSYEQLKAQGYSDFKIQAMGVQMPTATPGTSNKDQWWGTPNKTTAPANNQSAPATKLTAEQLVQKALAENSTSNLSGYSWWSSQDEATRKEAYAQLQGVTGSAQALADYVQKNGLTNLQNYSWWAQSPHKAEAWKIIQGGQKATDWKTAESLDDLDQYLNTKQEDLMKGDDVPVRDNTDLLNPENLEENIDYFSEALKPDMEAPKAAFEEKQEALFKEHGVETLEEDVNYWKAQEEEIAAQMRQRTKNEEGKTVPMGVIAGRVSEVERQEMERMDYVRRQLQTATDQLNSKYRIVESTMQAYGNDYKAATAEYERSYNENLQAINLMKGIQAEAKAEEEAAKDSARANLQVLYNNVVNGTLDAESMGADQKQMITKMEMQAGLPTGTFEALRSKDPEYSIKFTKDGTDQYGNQGVYLFKENARTGEIKTDFVVTGGKESSLFGGSSSGTSSGAYVPNKSLEGVKLSYEDGELKVSAPAKFWQCGEFVNRGWGIAAGSAGGFGDTYASKQAVVDKTGVKSGEIKDYTAIAPGMAFVKPINSGAYAINGHVGYVRTSPDEQGNFTTWEANAKGDGKISSRTLNVKDVYGFAPPPQGNANYQENTTVVKGYDDQKIELATRIQANPSVILDMEASDITRIKEFLGGASNYQRILNGEDPATVINGLENQQQYPDWLTGVQSEAGKSNIPFWGGVSDFLNGTSRSRTIADRYYQATGDVLREGTEAYKDIQSFNGDWDKINKYLGGLTKEEATPTISGELKKAVDLVKNAIAVTNADAVKQKLIEKYGEAQANKLMQLAGY